MQIERFKSAVPSYGFRTYAAMHYSVRILLMWVNLILVNLEFEFEERYMQLIDFEKIASLGITPAQCLEWVSEALLNKNRSILPPKTSLHPGQDGVFCNFMPCILPAQDGLRPGGIKIVIRYPGREPALQSEILLFDADSGESLAFLDADWITAMRTGAVAAHSINLLANQNYKIISIMGLGNTGRATLLMLAELLGGRDVEVKLLRHKGQEINFIERFSAFGNLHFRCVDNYEELIRDSDVIVSCVTYLEDDICEDSWFKKGVTLVPVHTRGFSSCDLFFDRIFADDKGHVCHFKNFDKFKSFGEVAEVIRGEIPGRQSNDERILIYNIGLAMHDIAFAGHIYQLLDKDDLETISLKQPSVKFWV